MRDSIDVVCDRIESNENWRRVFAKKTKRGDLLMMYMFDDNVGFSDAEIARHMDRIAVAEDLLEETR